jgi:hypothetical protein
MGQRQGQGQERKVDQADDEDSEEEGFEVDDYDDSAVREDTHSGGGEGRGRPGGTGDDEGEAEGEGEGEDSVEAYATVKKVPISHQVELTGHAKAVVCLSLEPAGGRVVTGSLDYSVKLFDFGGMDSRHLSFRSVEVQDGYPVTALAHAPGGDRFIVGTGSAQPKVYDREGKEVMKFVKGDMYIRDLTNTKGHTMEVTGVQWHPTEKNIVLTCSLDGSLRVWDLTGLQVFNTLVNKHVLKLRAVTAGQSRLGATSCCYTHDGSKVIGGGADGSIHIWVQKKVYSSRADFTLRPAHGDGHAVTCVVVSPNNQILASRGDDHAIRLWSLLTPALQAGQISKSGPTPLQVFSDLPNIYPSANVEFSPDGSLVCCGTTSVRGDTQKPLLCFFEVKPVGTSSHPRSSGAQQGPVGPVLQIGIGDVGVSVVFVRWHPVTNQIFCSTSTGSVKVMYDPRFSRNGALLTASKVPRRQKDPSDCVDGTVIGEIINPNALPMYRVEPSNKKRAREMKDPILTKAPEKKLDKGPNSKPNTSFFFTQYVTQGRAVDNSRAEDPREALIKMDALAKSDPIFFGRAYGTSQPQTMLHSMTFEEEQEDFKKKQKRV